MELFYKDKNVKLGQQPISIQIPLIAWSLRPWNFHSGNICSNQRTKKALLARKHQLLQLTFNSTSVTTWCHKGTSLCSFWSTRQLRSFIYFRRQETQEAPLHWLICSSRLIFCNIQTYTSKKMGSAPSQLEATYNLFSFRP